MVLLGSYDRIIVSRPEVGVLNTILVRISFASHLSLGMYDQHIPIGYDWRRCDRDSKDNWLVWVKNYWWIRIRLAQGVSTKRILTAPLLYSSFKLHMYLTMYNISVHDGRH